MCRARAFVLPTLALASQGLIHGLKIAQEFRPLAIAKSRRLLLLGELRNFISSYWNFQWNYIVSVHNNQLLRKYTSFRLFSRQSVDFGDGQVREPIFLGNVLSIKLWQKISNNVSYQ